MASEVPTLDKMLFMTKERITKKKKKEKEGRKGGGGRGEGRRAEGKKEEKDGDERKAVQIYRHFELLLAFMLKYQVGREASSLAR